MRRLHLATGFALACSLSFATIPPVALALDITTCGQTVPAGDVGVLTGDLACQLTDLLGVGLEPGATLDMNGFSMSGGDNIGVYCGHGSCTIVGPGRIENGGWVGVFVEDRTRLTVSDVTISGANVGIYASSLWWTATQVTATNVVIEDSREWSLSAKRIFADNLTITGNAATLMSMFARKVKGTTINISNNGTVGLHADRVNVTGLTATDNGGVGVEAVRAKLVDSTLQGNGISGSGVDLRSQRRPRLVNTTCGKSESPNGDWDVCLND